MSDRDKTWDIALIPPDMQEALTKFKSEADEILRSSFGYLESQEPPSLIYHYTNDIGLRGILESGRLWLTDVNGLNDPSELRHGFAKAIEVLKARSTDRLPETQTFARRFELFVTEGAIEKIAHFFVCSFSSHGNDLGQWRAYADNGRGYVLGFDGKALDSAFIKESNQPTSSHGTFPVIYNDARLADVHDQLIQKMFHLVSLPRGRHLERPVIGAYMMELQFWLTFFAVQVMLYFKHEAYNNEQEYRFLLIYRADSVPPERFRVRRYSLIRYTEFDWRKHGARALKQIIVGPAADREKAHEFAKTCLGSCHNNAVEITCSKIPYRVT